MVIAYIIIAIIFIDVKKIIRDEYVSFKFRLNFLKPEFFRIIRLLLLATTQYSLVPIDDLRRGGGPRVASVVVSATRENNILTYTTLFVRVK